MRMRGGVALAIVAAAIPVGAAAAREPVRTFDDVPDVRLNLPARGGWGPGGWSAGAGQPARAGGDRVAEPSRRQGDVRARGDAEAYDAGYDDGYADAMDRRGGGGGSSPGVRVETYPSRPDGHGAAGGTQVFNRPDGSTVVVVQSTPATRTVTYEEVPSVAPRRRARTRR